MSEKEKGPKEKDAAVAEESSDLVKIDYDGDTFEIPPSGDGVSYEALAAYARFTRSLEEGGAVLVSQAHSDDFLRSLLGPAQYRRLVSGRKVGEVNGFVRAVFEKWGTSEGE